MRRISDLVVAHLLRRPTSLLATPFPRLAVVEPGGGLAHDEHVEIAYPFSLKGDRSRGEPPAAAPGGGWRGRSAALAQDADRLVSDRAEENGPTLGVDPIARPLRL